MIKKIVGIDPSLTGTGICTMLTASLQFPGFTQEHQTSLIKPATKSGPERLIEIRDRVASFIQEADIVVIEGYSFGSKGAGVFQTAELGGVLRVMIREQGKWMVEVAPTQLKKFATGKGNAKKEEVKLGAYKRWGVEFKTSDETDAFCLSKIGEAILDEAARGKLTKPQREIVEQLIKEAK
jgi:crossover junction endodeoxyribonuclease RuvC